LKFIADRVADFHGNHIKSIICTKNKQINVIVYIIIASLNQR